MIISKLLKLSLKISRKQLLNSAIAGFLFLVYGNGIFVWALKYVDSGFAALLASTQPLFVLFLMRLIDGKKMQNKSIIKNMFDQLDERVKKLENLIFEKDQKKRKNKYD